jgi:hypothetical protein
VTTTATDLKAVEQAYSHYLGYKTVRRGTVDEATAIGWGAPAVAGKPILVMMPESGEPTYLRFVEQALPEGYKALTTYGWNATEIIVQDTDKLAEQLKGSPFEILSGPKSLDGIPDIRAMQGLGPAGEMLYLTWVQRPIPGVDLPVAKSFVDRCFIAVLGGADMDAMRRFYEDTFGNAPDMTMDAMVHVLSKAHNLPLETKYGLMTVPLGHGSLIEVDRYPDSATVRPRPPGGLPPGMAIVTFEYPGLNELNAPFIAPPQPSQLPPYAGTMSATVIGAAGELIELVEAVDG